MLKSLSKLWYWAFPPKLLANSMCYLCNERLGARACLYGFHKICEDCEISRQDQVRDKMRKIN